MKSKIILALKILFVFGLLYFLAQKGFISVEATQGALKQWKKILPAMLVLFLTASLGVVRWQWLLEAQNIHLSWKKIFQLTFIGNFFNIALPGAVSGDFVKAYYIGQEIKGKRSKAFGSILFDRVAGVSALVLVSAGTLLLDYRSYLNTPMFSAIQFLVGTAAICVLAFYGYLFLIQEHHDPILRALRRAEKVFKKTSALTRIYESLRHYHHHRMAVVKAVFLSALIHLALGWACLNFAEALGESQLHLSSIWIVAPLGLLLTAVPIAPAGVGTGNIAFLYFFHLIGSERGADIFSLLALSNIIIGGLGGLIYFRFRSEGNLPGMNPAEAN